MHSERVLGIDLGSVSVKLALVENGAITRTVYRRHLGRPYETLGIILPSIPGWSTVAACVTGSAARAVGAIAGARPVNEVVALAAAICRLHPEFGSVIEMGGQDSKLLLFRIEGRKCVFDDFSMNSVCAAGTGSFLDQQATRLGMDAEELGMLALRCPHPPRVAGRCSVFAKSDMIHLQQVGTPPEDIVAGLCLAVARNFKSIIAGGKEFRPPVGFVGGVASNAGMVRAFGEVLSECRGGITVPSHSAELTAAGAALCAEDDQVFIAGEQFTGLLAGLGAEPAPAGSHPPLMKHRGTPPPSFVPAAPGAGTGYHLGIDVGSISTNLAAIDEAGRLAAREYLMTAGRPIEAVKKGLALVGATLGGGARILSAGVTGSGRYMIGDFTGADTVVNEITAQARAAVEACPDVDTVFEIGGQDSKYISIQGGRVVDFEMNKVCAAGTGSFLEEQAERLGLGIREFGPVALEAPAPSGLGERCTVFMESDVVAHQAAGAPVEDIVGGLCYSIVQNYLHRVVGDRKPGRRILFQGGTAYNAGVVAAFNSVLGRSVTVPPDHDVTGAIGAALIARDRSGGKPSSFRGFGLSGISYTQSSFVCEGCPNRCEIHSVGFDDGRRLHYGGRCEKYETGRRPAGGKGVNLFPVREEILLRGYRPPDPGADPSRLVGIPRALWFWEFFPFFRSFFESLGFGVVLSSPSTGATVHKGVENVAAETCFPVKIAHGHVLDLLERGAGRIFLPSMLRAFRHEGFEEAQNCPYVSGSPYVIESSLGLAGRGVGVLAPVLDFTGQTSDWKAAMISLGESMGCTPGEASRAVGKALEAQHSFERAIREAGREALDSLPDNGTMLVIVSRPYNGCDPSVSSDLPAKLSRMGVGVMPAEMLDLPMRETAGLCPDMYWHYGQKILAAALAVKRDPRLRAVYLTNFGCGPDSFIHHHFSSLMDGTPFLTLEADEHSADAGMITRCEAFLDSLPASAGAGRAGVTEAPGRRAGRVEGRTIWVPRLGPGTALVAAAARRRGLDAREMPETDRETVAMGRTVTSGKECYPAIITSGNMLKVLGENDPDRTAFFMGTASGPCRFGQYCTYHRILLDRSGFSSVPIITASSRDSYTSVPGLNSPSFQLDLLRGTTCADILKAAYRRTSPYEAREGDAMRAFATAMSLVEKAMEKGEGLGEAMRKSAGLFGRIPLSGAERPLVLVFGEIYVRNDPYANSWTEDRIEALGGEVLPTWVLEWFEFVNHTFMTRALRSRKPADILRAAAKSLLMKHVKRSLERPFAWLLAGRHHPGAAEVLEAAGPYMKENIGGEAILCIGAPVALARRGAIDGAVNVLPFTCLPGTIVTAVSKRLRRDLPGLPWLNLAFDGQEDTDNDARLEAFMFQVRSGAAARGSDRRAGSDASGGRPGAPERIRSEERKAPAWDRRDS